MRHCLGRRGAFLLVWGLLFVLYGIGLFFQPLPAQPSETLLLHQQIPAPLRAALWVITGVLAIRYAFARTPSRDRWGFYALLAMPLLRMASYFVAWVVFVVMHTLAPWFGVHHDYGDPRGWVSAAFYGVLFSTITIVSGWAENALTKDRP